MCTAYKILFFLLRNTRAEGKKRIKHMFIIHHTQNAHKYIRHYLLLLPITLIWKVEPSHLINTHRAHLSTQLP
uniref:Uncharacterized protein n=1 Tax=Populus trichocarpa TaxID=3694 RepID=A0A2K2C7C4_POPTR